MYGHPKHNRDMSGFEPPVIKLMKSGSLSWRNQDSSGVCGSGWNPFKGLVVSMIDDTATTNSVSLFIEPPAPGTGICCMMFCVPFFPFFWPLMCPQLVLRANAHAYLFTKNENGIIDLLHRRKPFFGVEIRKTYSDVTHFCATVTRYRDAPTDIHDESISQSYFLLTYEGGEIKLPTGENFSSLSLQKLTEITDVVNSLISTSLEGRQDLNGNLQPTLHVVGMPITAGYYVSTVDERDMHNSAFADVADSVIAASADDIVLDEGIGRAVGVMDR